MSAEEIDWDKVVEERIVEMMRLNRMSFEGAVSFLEYEARQEEDRMLEMIT